MGHRQRLSRSIRSDVLQSRSHDVSVSRGTEAANNGGERVTRAATSPRPACTGASGPNQGLGHSCGSPRAQLSSVGPSILHRWNRQNDIEGPWNPLPHAPSTGRASNDLTAIAEKLQHVPLSELHCHQHGVVRSKPGGGGPRAETGLSTKATNAGKPKKASYADALRGSDTPLIKSGRATMTKDGLSCFACFCCKYKLLEARRLGVQTTTAAPLCQQVAEERSVRRYSIERHIPPRYRWNDCGITSRTEYNKLNNDNGEYIQTARRLANQQGLRGREREEFIWRTCFVLMYPAYASVRHLLNPYEYMDTSLNTTQLRTIGTSRVQGSSHSPAARAGTGAPATGKPRVHDLANASTSLEGFDTSMSMGAFISAGTPHRVADQFVPERHHPTEEHGRATPTWANVAARGPEPYPVPYQPARNATTSRPLVLNHVQYSISTQEHGFDLTQQANNVPNARNSQPSSRPQQERCPEFNHSRSTATRNRQSVQPALPLCYSDMIASYQMEQHHEMYHEEHRPPRMTEPRAEPSCSFTQLMSTEFQDLQDHTELSQYTNQAAGSTQRTGLATPMSQQPATPSLGRSTDTGHSSWPPPPTPTGQGWSSPTAQVGPAEVLSGLRFAPQQCGQGALSNTAEGMERLPESEEFWKQFVNDSPSPPRRQRGEL